MKNVIRMGILGISLCLMMTPAFAQVGMFDNETSWGPRGSSFVPGESSFSGGTYTLRGNGDDIWNNDDEGYFLYNELEGSFSIEAQMEWVDPGTNDWSKLGVMIRENATEATSRHFWAQVRGAGFGDLVNNQFRTDTGGGSSGFDFTDENGENIQADANAQIYLRVTRYVELGLFVAEYSYDGTDWTFGNSVPMEWESATAAYGLAITSHVDDEFLVEGLAHNVAVNPAPPIASRSFSDDAFSAGTSIVVSLDVLNPGDSAQNLTLTENIPDGWTASAISDGGSASGSTVTWSLNVEPGITTISYTVTAPDTIVDEAAVFSGDLSGTANAGNAQLSFVETVSIGEFDKLADWGPRGTFKAEGEASFADGAYTLRANGDDIWNNDDEGLFLYTEKTGSWSLSGRVEWIDPGSNEWSKTGVMVRESGPLATSRHYWIELRGAAFGDRVDAQWRTATGGGSGNVQAFDPDGLPVQADGLAQIWLRVTRYAELDLFVSEASYDGEEWFTVHSQTQEWPSDTAAFGLASTSHVDDEFLTEALVAEVELVPAPSIASRSVGADMAFAGDSVDVAIQVLNSDTSNKTINLVETLPSGWTPSNITGGGSASGSTITWAYDAPPGLTEVSYTMTASSSGTVGSFFGESTADGNDMLGDSGVIVFSAVDSLVFEFAGDIFDSFANLGAAGSHSVSGGNHTLTGSGNDIWNNADNFHFMFVPLSGDFTLTATVSEFDPGTSTNEWVKAGLMAREDLSAGAVNFMARQRTDGQFSSQWRPVADGGGSSTPGADRVVLGNPGTTMQIQRVGDDFTTRYDDGAGNFIDIDTVNVPMADPIYVGVCVTAHEVGSLSTITYSDVELIGSTDIVDWQIMD